MRFFAFYLACFCCLFFVQGNCKKDDAPGNKINIEGFILTDNLGNTMGVQGYAGDDWKIRDWSQLFGLEQSFLSFPDTVNMSNTAVSVINEPTAYPNPCANVGAINFHSTDSVKVKLAIANASGQVLQTHAFKVKGNRQFVFDFSDTNIYRSGLSLRYYFSYSAASQANFKAGYGDVKICRVSPTSQCF